MTCRELAEFLDEYLEGALGPAALDAFHRHLEECPACVTYVDTYHRVARASREAFTRSEAAVPPEVPEALVQAILRARRDKD